MEGKKNTLLFCKLFVKKRSGGQKKTPPCYKLFVKKRSGGQKKNTSLLQTFCKKSQWRAKKLRERGSNAARQPKKGGGGHRFGRDSVAIRCRFRRVDALSMPCRCRRQGAKTAKRREKLTSFFRFRRVDALSMPCRCRRQGAKTAKRREKLTSFFRFRRVEYKPKHKKSPTPRGNRACSCCYASRVLLIG